MIKLEMQLKSCFGLYICNMELQRKLYSKIKIIINKINNVLNFKM